MHPKIKQILAAIDVRMVLDRCGGCDHDLLEKRYLYGYEIRELARDQGCIETAVLGMQPGTYCRRCCTSPACCDI